jgi:hypothetical protein
MTAPAHRVLAAAAYQAGLNADGAQLVRDGSNAMFRLPDQVMARVGQPGSAAAAGREVQVSRWLESAGISVTHALRDVDQPIVIEDRPVTWWRLIPEHRAATPGELGSLLRALHALPIPADLDLPTFDPFAGLLAPPDAVDGVDLGWVESRVRELRGQCVQQIPGMSVIHGDAWQGNVVVASPTRQSCWIWNE